LLIQGLEIISRDTDTKSKYYTDMAYCKQA